jgi:hypothetical protein
MNLYYGSAHLRNLVMMICGQEFKYMTHIVEFTTILPFILFGLDEMGRNSRFKKHLSNPNN